MLENNMTNKHLGYYLCDGIEFSSKIDALFHSTRSNKPVEWYFNRLEFDNYNWQVEPTESLDQLYDRRSRQLREKYDYVVLSFSGGADTNNILESFIRQGLHIDEIVTNHMTELTKSYTLIDSDFKDSWNFAAEHQLQAVPRLQYITDKLPRTKITVLDVSNSVVDAMKDFSEEDWVLHRNDHISPGQLFRYNYFHFGEIKKKFDQGKSACIIVGVDKPKTQIDNNGNFFIYFNDTTANITTINDFNKEYSNVTTELFYWSPDSVDMVCKQAHVIKRWLELDRPDRQGYWRNTGTQMRRLYHERWLRSLLYSTWDNSWYQADKSIQWWNTEFDGWFKRLQQFEKERENWRNGLFFLRKNIPKYVNMTTWGIPDSLLDFKQKYIIGKMKNGFNNN